ncbi:MAG TPA: SPOR domain-containing protein [Novosphingobium sp.]|nr:SPOR domain-containing protein [Novosphingobium sp.]
MIDTRTSFVRLCASTALAAVLLGSFATDAGARSQRNSGSAKAGSAKSIGKAVSLAEQAVLAAPRDAAARAALGAAYLKAGRFASATAAYDAALELGDESVPTVLGLALAETAQGHDAAALELLNDWRDVIPASDLGLAFALAGDPERGVALLADALRGGDNTPKARQNLAFAYALGGRWREARLMVAQDVPADQVAARISQWAMLGKPEDTQARVAHLLGVPMVGDAGQPAALALANFPSPEQLAAQAAPAAVEASAPIEQVAAVEEAPAAAPIELAALTLPATNVASDSPVFVANAVIQALPVTMAPVTAKPRVAGSPLVQVRETAAQPGKERARLIARPAAKVVAGGTHLVQLGSYTNQAIAREGWGKFTARTPALKPYRMSTTTATVGGAQVWRVAAAGFASYADANAMCRTVKSRGGACLVVSAPKAVVGGGSGFARR